MKPISILVLGKELNKTQIKDRLNGLNKSQAVKVSYAEDMGSATHDIYIISQPSIIESIRNTRRGSKIFAICDMRDSRTLKNLLNLDIDGYINTEDYEIDSLIETVNSSLEFRTQAEKIEQKMQTLSVYNDNIV